MMAIGDLIGDDKVNGALASLLNKFKYQSNPYPTTRDLKAELFAVAPESAHDFIRQQFEEINIYDLHAKSAEVVELDNGEFEVRLDISAIRIKNDGQGVETEMDFASDVAIALYREADDNADTLDSLIQTTTLHLGEKDNQVVIVSKEKPASILVDPNYRYIDRDRKNNRVKL